MLQQTPGRSTTARHHQLTADKMSMPQSNATQSTSYEFSRQCYNIFQSAHCTPEEHTAITTSSLFKPPKKDPPQKKKKNKSRCHIQKQKRKMQAQVSVMKNWLFSAAGG
jgi:hypothetical protein